MWTTAVSTVFRLRHPCGKLQLLMTSYPGRHSFTVPVARRQVDIIGFSAGSFTGLALHEVLCHLKGLNGMTKVAGSWTSLLGTATGECHELVGTTSDAFLAGHSGFMRGCPSMFVWMGHL